MGAYVVGSIPSGRLIGLAVSHIDITQKGSGNVGATNVSRELGYGWGLFTLLLDALKGFLPAALYAHQEPAHAIGVSLVGLASLLGHQFSIFQIFRGGKGVSTALGFFLVVSPLACLIALLMFIATVFRWGYISLGSMLSACVMPMLLALLHKDLPYVFSSVGAAILICLRHRDNLRRLAAGREPTWPNPTSQERNSKSRSNSSSE
jgi:glycerol-3-phosphate acyltransferase PlsY